MFADILLNHSFSKKQEKLTYLVPENANIQKGSGVIVPFGKNKKVGVVLSVHKERPEFDTKSIINTLTPNILLSPWQFLLIDWITEHYFCSKFEVIRMMLPKHIWRIPKNERKANTSKNKFIAHKGHELSKEQKEIYDSLIKENPQTSLIHGVTGAGKTELYKNFIQSKVSQGFQTLLMVPEISLTPQFVKYFEGSVPEIEVIHSKISDGKKAKIWKKILEGETNLVIGSRSSLFSPFKNLGLIIMDEEHEYSYKQDSSPRYHARDVALKISEITGANLIFGSATPSIETMYKAKTNEYKYYSLDSRIHGTPLPKVEIIDMREELKKGNFSIFSSLLEQKISSCLEKKEQAILFLNRRGSASATVCRDCGNALSCKNCDIKLTYHAAKFSHETLICHYCGLITKMPPHCPNCKSVRIRHFGIGTQKVQSELEKLFPLAKIQRADKDTMTKRDSFTRLHKELNNNEIDVLIGTQMIGKGFDLPKVTLVGVIMADIGIHIPDFRASERSFQLLTQVAGRSGRRKDQGEVIIQTYSPEHPSLIFSQTHNYNAFYEQEIDARKRDSLPPFGKFVKLIYVDPDRNKCEEEAKILISNLAADNDHKIYSAPALTPKLYNKYHWHVLIHGPNPSSLIKNIDQALIENWRIDVDPIQTV
ncbi:primosomal protein N' [Patescibacteria group bacterium]|nr:primosomal protein N' [Patescibacteria group bacterium]